MPREEIYFSEHDEGFEMEIHLILVQSRQVGSLSDCFDAKDHLVKNTTVDRMRKEISSF